MSNLANAIELLDEVDEQDRPALVEQLGALQQMPQLLEFLKRQFRGRESAVFVNHDRTCPYMTFYLNGKRDAWLMIEALTDLEFGEREFLRESYIADEGDPSFET